MKRIFKLNPEKNLTHQWPFWLINGILFLLAIILTVIIVSKGNYYPDWSPKGFKLFLSDFGFPMSISALIIPASALIATMHRSSQLSTQINLLMEQNNFANYYKHFEEFEKYLSKISNSDNEEFFKGRVIDIYRKFFPDARNGSYRIDSDLSIFLDRQAEELISLFEGIENGGDLGVLLKELNSSNLFIAGKFSLKLRRINIPNAFVTILPTTKEEHCLRLVNKQLQYQQEIFRLLLNIFLFEENIYNEVEYVISFLRVRSINELKGDVYISSLS